MQESVAIGALAPVGCSMGYAVSVRPPTRSDCRPDGCTSRVDLISSDAVSEFVEHFKSREIELIPISAKQQTGLEELRHAIDERL